MRKYIALLLALLLCQVPLYACLEAAVSPEDVDALEITILPQGTWTISSEGSWLFILESDTPLNESQQSAALAGQLYTEDGILPAGHALTQEAIETLYPGAEAYLSPPKTKPDVSMFSLTGTWYYGEDDRLYYQHDDQSEVMTKEAVFAALSGEVSPSQGEKIIYLTIDDAPSDYTMELLATLDALGVKATFFVMGASVKRRPVYLRAIYEQGHVIANHSYSHNAEVLKSSFQSCLKDFMRCEAEVEKALGFSLEMPILRVPYGSSTIPASYRSMLQDRGYTWIDWNALNGDAENETTSEKALLERAYSTAKRQDGAIVMLVHDGKKGTIRTLPEMVEHFRAQGYVFRVLDPSIGKIDGVRMGVPSTDP